MDTLNYYSSIRFQSVNALANTKECSKAGAGYP